MIEVWAPTAGRVDLSAVADGVPLRAPLSPCDDGWWRWDGDPRAYDVLDYGFRIDGAGLLPDPRSAWQPHGVHDRSRFWAGEPLASRDPTWPGPRGGAGALGGVIYELHVGTFTAEGTLDGAISRLDHLVSLGVDVVEVMPLAAFPGSRGWGYDGVGFYSVHDTYGGPDAFVRFIDACHARGLGVCLDVVVNHLGPDGNHLARFGPYFTDQHHTPWGWAVNLDDESSAVVRGFIIDAVQRWFEVFGVDALRLDAVHELKDDSPVHFLAELSSSVASLSSALGRPLDLIAESDLNDPRMVTPVAAGGLGMSAQWADDVHHALHVALTGETQGYYADFADSDALAKTLTGAFFHDGGFSSFRSRDWGAPVDRARISGHRFVAYLQTHDQVGNRARGDRITASVTPGQQAIGAALYLLSAFTPMVFMGEEWAASTPWQFFTDFEDRDLGRAVSEGRRSEFASHGWSAAQVPDPQAASTREVSVLQWSEPTGGDHATMLDWYRELIALRRTEPDLASGDLLAVSVTHPRPTHPAPISPPSPTPPTPSSPTPSPSSPVEVIAPGGPSAMTSNRGWIVLRRSTIAVVANLDLAPCAVDLDPTPDLDHMPDPGLGPFVPNSTEMSQRGVSPAILASFGEVSVAADEGWGEAASGGGAAHTVSLGGHSVAVLRLEG